MKKILFLIHDLGQGGAEKVLVNLVNNMDRSKFDISVIALFGGGVNEQFLKKDIHYKAIFPKAFPGNSHIMKIFPPKQLHRMFVKEHYDIEVAYLEGPSARVISGCEDENTKLVSWIHVQQHNMKELAKSFRNETEAIECYNRFDNVVCVSESVKEDFCRILNFQKTCQVLYNTVESDVIWEKAKEEINKPFERDVCNLIAVGTLKESKGYERLFRIINKLVQEEMKVHLYVLGIGPLKNKLDQYIQDNSLEKNITLLGYDTNPYKYIAKSDLFVCASYAEGFSTATTEALILGVPVCTVDVAGMKELLGEHNEYGVITANSEDDLYKGIKGLLEYEDVLKRYIVQSQKRGYDFGTEKTVKEVEEFLEKDEKKNDK